MRVAARCALQETEAKQAHNLNFQEGTIKATVRSSNKLRLTLLRGALRPLLMPTHHIIPHTGVPSRADWGARHDPLPWPCCHQ